MSIKKCTYLIMLFVIWFSLPVFAKVDVSEVIGNQISNNNTGLGIVTTETSADVVEQFLKENQGDLQENNVNAQNINGNQSSNANINHNYSQSQGENVDTNESHTQAHDTEINNNKEDIEILNVEGTNEIVYDSENIDDTGAGTTGLTPSGNFTLVDDIKITSDEDTTEFLTVATKNGNYLYLIIDKNEGKENVHMLNMVDETDLLSLITGEPVSFVPQAETPQTNYTPPVEMEQEIETETEISTSEPVETGVKTSSMINIILIIILLGGGGFAYYKFFYNKEDEEDYTHASENEEERDPLNDEQLNQLGNVSNKDED